MQSEQSARVKQQRRERCERLKKLKERRVRRGDRLMSISRALRGRVRREPKITLFFLRCLAS
jgi:hypothetical protein